MKQLIRFRAKSPTLGAEAVLKAAYVLDGELHVLLQIKAGGPCEEVGSVELDEFVETNADHLLPVKFYLVNQRGDFYAYYNDVRIFFEKDEKIPYQFVFVSSDFHALMRSGTSVYPAGPKKLEPLDLLIDDPTLIAPRAAHYPILQTLGITDELSAPHLLAQHPVVNAILESLYKAKLTRDPVSNHNLFAQIVADIKRLSKYSKPSTLAALAEIYQLLSASDNSPCLLTWDIHKNLLAGSDFSRCGKTLAAQLKSLMPLTQQIATNIFACTWNITSNLAQLMELDTKHECLKYLLSQKTTPQRLYHFYNMMDIFTRNDKKMDLDVFKFLVDHLDQSELCDKYAHEPAFQQAITQLARLQSIHLNMLNGKNLSDFQFVFDRAELIAKFRGYITDVVEYFAPAKKQTSSLGYLYSLMPRPTLDNYLKNLNNDFLVYFEPDNDAPNAIASRYDL